MELLVQAGAKLFHFSLALGFTVTLTMLAVSVTLSLVLLNSDSGVELGNLVGVLARSRDFDRACPVEVEVA